MLPSCPPCGASRGRLGRGARRSRKSFPCLCFRRPAAAPLRAAPLRALVVCVCVVGAGVGVRLGEGGKRGLGVEHGPLRPLERRRTGRAVRGSRRRRAEPRLGLQRHSPTVERRRVADAVERGGRGERGGEADGVRRLRVPRCAPRVQLGQDRRDRRLREALGDALRIVESVPLVILAPRGLDAAQLDGAQELPQMARALAGQLTLDAPARLRLGRMRRKAHLNELLPAQSGARERHVRAEARDRQAGELEAGKGFGDEAVQGARERDACALGDHAGGGVRSEPKGASGGAAVKHRDDRKLGLADGAHQVGHVLKVRGTIDGRRVAQLCRVATGRAAHVQHGRAQPGALRRSRQLCLDRAGCGERLRPRL